MTPREGVDWSALEAYEESLSGVKAKLLDVTGGVLSFSGDSTELTTREEKLKDDIFRVSPCIHQLHNSIPIVPNIIPKGEVKVISGELPKIKIPT